MADSTRPIPLLFLSHSGTDTEAARILKRRIEDAPDARERGLTVWFDKDQLRPGEPWQTQLEEAIERRATAFAVYVGARGVINWVEAEVRLGLSRAIAGRGRRFPFIPILASGAKGLNSLPGFALQFQGVRDVETNVDEFQKLIAAVLGDGAVGLRELEKEPFFGLKAIDETRSHLFFGRERETQELIERLSGTHLLMVTGDSGSGKSSLVRAGLIPKWRGGVLSELKGKRPDEAIWHVIETRPGLNPRRALGDAVFAAAKRLGESAANCGTYKGWVTNGGPENIRDGLRCGLDADRTRTLLVVDQLEELLTLVPKEQRHAFVELLLALADPKDDAFVLVLTMRRDYYNLCSEFPSLYNRLEANDRQARYLLGRMPNRDMRRVITQPLKLAGVKRGAREALARNVLLDVGERPGDLALVQFALTMTWEHRKKYEGDLLQSYSALGRVEGALAQAADKVYADPDVLGGDGNEREIEAVFLRLVRLGDTGGATRRVASHREFSAARWGMLQSLADEKGNRLVQISGPEGDERVEIAHEALVTQWPRFQRWLQAAAGDKRTFDDLIERAAKWTSLEKPLYQPNESKNSGKEKYVATGAELQLFEDLAKRHKDWLSPGEIEYVEISSYAQRRAETRRNWLFGAVTAASILFAIAAKQAKSADAQAELAREQTRIAIANESRALSALSRQATADNEPNQAAQLALAAWPRDDSDLRPRLETTLQSLSKALDGGRLYLHQWRHDGPVVGARLIKDENRILSWSEDGTLRIWDIATGQVGPAMMHDGPVSGAMVTKDENRILSWSKDDTLRIWDAATGQQIGPAMMHDGPVSGAMVTKDENRILSWSKDDTLRIWDAATGQQIGPAMMHDGPVAGAALLRDEMRILSWSGNTLSLWDVGTGQQITPAMKHDGEVVGAVLTKDETRILSWSSPLHGEGTLRLWDTATGQQIGPAMRHDTVVVGARLMMEDARILSWSASPVGSTKLLLEKDNTLRLWDAATGQQIGPAMKHDSWIRGALLTTDERRILSWSGGIRGIESADNTMRLWDAATGQQIGPAMQHDDSVLGAVMTKDGMRILSWSEDHTLRLWDAATGWQIGLAMRHEGPVSGAVLTKDERRILSWSTDGTLRLWDAATGQQIGSSMQHDDSVLGAVLTKDGMRILSWSEDHTLRLWDAATGWQIGLALKHEDVFEARLTTDETHILSWSLEGTLRLWDAATGQQIGPIMKDDEGLQGALLMKDATRILSWGGNTLRLWDPTTGQQIGPAMKHDSVSGVVMTKDEAHILSWSGGFGSDNTLRRWEAATGRQIGPAMKHDGPVSGAMLTKDETRILSWGGNTLRLWDPTTGQQIGPAMKHDGPVSGAMLTKDETRILSWSTDHTLRIWDAATGQQIGPAMKHDGPVSGAMLTKDETRILSWSTDHTLRIWDAATGQQIGPAMKHDGPVSGAVMTKDERRILSWSDNTLRLWDVATSQQIGPAMKHEDSVSGAVMTKDETRILSWSTDHTLRLWDQGWPKGNLLEIACALLTDYDAVDASKNYGVKIRDRICSAAIATGLGDWSLIERAP